MEASDVEGLALAVGGFFHESPESYRCSSHRICSATLLTVHDSEDPKRLVGKKLIKQIAPGEAVTIQVRNADGRLSNTATFTRE